MYSASGVSFMPATYGKDLTPEQIEGLSRISEHYVENANRYRLGLRKLA